MVGPRHARASSSRSADPPASGIAKEAAVGVARDAGDGEPGKAADEEGGDGCEEFDAAAAAVSRPVEEAALHGAGGRGVSFGAAGADEGDGGDALGEEGCAGEGVGGTAGVAGDGEPLEAEGVGGNRYIRGPVAHAVAGVVVGEAVSGTFEDDDTSAGFACDRLGFGTQVA